MGMNKFLVVGGGLTDPSALSALTVQTTLDSALVGSDYQDSTALPALTVDSTAFSDSQDAVKLSNILKTFNERIQECYTDITAIHGSVDSVRTAIISIDSKLALAN